MAPEWLEALHKRAEAVYSNGQLEKGKDGTVHLQYFVNLSDKNKKRVTQMKKLCAYTHWEPVRRDNGASSYAMKEDTRVEGPWEFGEKPLCRNKKADWDKVW